MTKMKSLKFLVSDSNMNLKTYFKKKILHCKVKKTHKDAACLCAVILKHKFDNEKFIISNVQAFI